MCDFFHSYGDPHLAGSPPERPSVSRYLAEKEILSFQLSLIQRNGMLTRKYEYHPSFWYSINSCRDFSVYTIMVLTVAAYIVIIRLHFLSYRIWWETVNEICVCMYLCSCIYTCMYRTCVTWHMMKYECMCRHAQYMCICMCVCVHKWYIEHAGLMRCNHQMPLSFCFLSSAVFHRQGTSSSSPGWK